MARPVVLGIALALCALPLWPALAGPSTNDYPTEARADYVFACMATNGGTREALQRCSCVIDVIAGLLPYGDYEKAETVLRMRHLTGGYLAQTFHVPQANVFVERLQDAQAEGDVRCF
ncbi:MAG TPA: hypothetical protein VFN42_04320 [Acetobacteraceae bacterium]|nr:hypothetical protein [Acetobacteraceae bacterium]